MEKNNKGFTLVELLVVIVLMLTILGIAILSFIKVNDNKKEDAWEKVKEQIEVAALEYVDTNEYLFEGLSDKFSASISVGKLVEEDYLNKIVNPMTGKTIDNCSLIEIKKKNSKLTASYKDYSSGDKCDSSLQITTVESGAPSGRIYYVGKTENTISPTSSGWFNIADLGESGKLKVCIEGKTEGNGPITSATIGNLPVTREGNNFCTYVEEDGIYSNTLMSLTNSSGKKWMVYNTIKKDTIKPWGNLEIVSKDTWQSRNVKLSFNLNDNKSGLNVIKVDNVNYNSDMSFQNKLSYTKADYSYSFSSKLPYDGSVKKININVTDVAGNTNSISQDYTLFNKCQKGNIIDDGNWYDVGKRQTCTNSTGKLTIKQEKKQKDKVSGDSCEKLTRNYGYTAPQCFASKCSTTKVYGSNSVCKSNYGNTVSARLKIQCNGKIDYVKLKYYYPGANYKDCTGNVASRAVYSQYPRSLPSNNDINGAVFNLLGCGVNTVTYKYQVVSNGKVIHDYDDNGWATYNFKTADNASVLCEPTAGSYWFK